MRTTRSTRKSAALTLCAATLLHLGGFTPASADPIFTGKVSLTGLYYTEDDGTIVAKDSDKIADQTKARSATSARLGFVELRGLVEGKRLWGDRLDLRLDLRLRLTGSLDFENKFTTTTAAETDPFASPGLSARGYLGGQEYELRQAYGLLRLSDRYTLQLGRMYVTESDSIKVDGARVLRSFGGRVQGSAFAGAYPNPFSRSLLTDYAAPCGAGVLDPSAPEPGAVNGSGPCQSSSALAFAAGLTAKYDLQNLWGAAALTGIYMNGPGDGGPVVARDTVLMAAQGAPQYLQPAQAGVDAPRVFVSWLNSWRPLERLTVFSDIVVDLYGSGGPQLTRLVATGTLRLLREDRLSLRLGYAHLSSLAVNLFLRNTLYNRLAGSTLGVASYSVVVNNLTVLRTGRDEVRGTADWRVARQLGVYLDGRFRYRALLNGDSVPGVYDRPEYQSNTRSIAGDITAGVRDNGSLYGVRAGLSYTALFDFRAQSHILMLGLGRDLWRERLSLDLSYNLALTSDAGAGNTDTCSSSDPFLLGCFGRRSGMTHEVGLTTTLNPWRTLFFLVDYRFVALLTDPQGTAMAPVEVPSILSHSVLVRGEYRW